MIDDGVGGVSPARGVLQATASTRLPGQSTDLGIEGSEEERIHFHRSPLPEAMLVSMLAGIPATGEQQHFTMEQIVAILTLDPPQEVNPWEDV